MYMSCMYWYIFIEKFIQFVYINKVLVYICAFIIDYHARENITILLSIFSACVIAVMWQYATAKDHSCSRCYWYYDNKVWPQVTSAHRNLGSFQFHGRFSLRWIAELIANWLINYIMRIKGSNYRISAGIQE